MKIIKLFFSNLKWVFIANIYSSLSKFFILIFIAQILTTTEVGIYTLGLAITAPITLLFNMKMKSVIITEQEPRIPIFKRIRVCSNFLAVTLIFIISYLLYYEYLVAILLIGIIKILDINSEYYQSLPNRNKDFHLTSKLIISKYSLITITFVVSLAMTSSLIYALMSYIIIQLLHLVLERNVFNKYVMDEYNKVDVKYTVILGFMIPLGITQMLYSFGASVPKYYLENVGTIEQVGIFSALLYFVTIINMLMGSLFQTILPYAMNSYSKSTQNFNKIIFLIFPLISLIFCALLYIPVYLWGELILNIVYGEVYAQHYKLLYMLIITIYFNILGWGFDSALLISRSIKIQPVLNFINIVITSTLGVFLIAINPLIGATITITIYHFINFLFKFIYYFIRGKSL